MSLPAPVRAPASIPSPAACGPSLSPGLYLQTLHSSHGHCQILCLPHCSCHSSPLTRLSFTASGSCPHHHPPLLQTSAWACCCYSHSPTAHGHKQCLLPSRGALPHSKAPADPPGSPKAASPTLGYLPTPPACHGTSQKARPAEHCHSEGPFAEQQEGYKAVPSAIRKTLRAQAQKLKRLLSRVLRAHPHLPLWHPDP